MKTQIWTDASVKDGVGFIGLVILQDGAVVSTWSTRIDHCDSHYAELYGIYCAIHHARTMDILSVEILSDDQSSVRQATPNESQKAAKGKKASRLQSDIFDLLSLFDEVSITWKPSHYNLAHEVAYSAMREGMRQAERCEPAEEQS